MEAGGGFEYFRKDEAGAARAGQAALRISRQGSDMRDMEIPMDDIPISELRARLSHYAHQVNVRGVRVLVTLHGQEMFALVPPRDLHRLDRVDRSNEKMLEARHEARMREFRMMKDGQM